MNERKTYNALLRKLEETCSAAGLSAALRVDGYPVAMEVRPARDQWEQMSLLPEAVRAMSDDAFLRFEMRDGEIGTRTGGTFVISDAVLSKLRSLFKSIEHAWLQFFFREVLEQELIPRECMPDPEADGEADGEEADEDP